MSAASLLRLMAAVRSRGKVADRDGIDARRGCMAGASAGDVTDGDISGLVRLRGAFCS